MRTALLLLALTALVIQPAYGRNEERGNRGKYSLYNSSGRSQEAGQAELAQAIIKKVMLKAQTPTTYAKPSTPTISSPTSPTTHPQPLVKAVGTARQEGASCIVVDRRALSKRALDTKHMQRIEKQDNQQKVKQNYQRCKKGSGDTSEYCRKLRQRMKRINS